MATRRSNKSGLPFEQIKIGYIEADVNAVESRQIEKRDNIFGEWFAKNHEIDFDEAMVEPEKANTILHEVLHAIVHVWGIEFKDSEQEETIVNSMSSAMVTIIKDNPEFIMWLYNTFHGDAE